jgi:crotonobetainyl-CoA:carnitine CoA-transferase CaiB-like acyl-CoA transferase
MTGPATAATRERRALGGLRVVEWGDLVPAAFCGKLLADLGADVVKIEPPSGDGARAYGPFPQDRPSPERSGLFAYLHTNKAGVTLDTRAATGRRLLRALLRSADVLVTDLPAHRRRAQGLTFADLHPELPELIYAGLSPFGGDGPYRDFRAGNLETQALGGICYSLGAPERPPLSLPGHQSDYQAGLMGAIGVLVAYLARADGAPGQEIDVAAAEIWAGVHSGGAIVTYLFQGLTGQRAGHRRPDPYPSTILPCRDGYFVLSAKEGRQWKSFLEIMGNPDWARDPRFQNRRTMGEQYADEVDARVTSWLVRHTKQELFDRCREKKVPFAPVQTVGDLVRDAHMAERGFFARFPPDAPQAMTLPGAPYRLSETPWQIRRPAPRRGEHNVAIYCGRLGLSRTQLTRLRRAGVI